MSFGDGENSPLIKTYKIEITGSVQQIDTDITGEWYNRPFRCIKVSHSPADASSPAVILLVAPGDPGDGSAGGEVLSRDFPNEVYYVRPVDVYFWGSNVGDHLMVACYA